MTPVASTVPRRIAAWLVGGVVATTGAGCDPDPRPVCTDTYQHLLTLAHRNHDATLMARFVDACSASFDPERLACIKAAATTGAALACKPVRKRPS